MDGNKLILVPGMFSTQEVFRGIVLEAAKAGIIVEVVDFPMSSGPEGYIYTGSCQLDFWDKLKFLLDFLRKQTCPYDLGGHSAGALLVLKVAEETEVNPGRIFLISPAPPKRIFGLYPSVIKSFFFVLKTPFFSSKSFRITYQRFKWAMANTISSEERLRRIYKNLRPESGKFIAQIGLALLDKSNATLIDFSRILCSIHMIVGSRDRVTPAGVAWAIKKIAQIEREGTPAEKFKVSCTEIKGDCHWLIEKRIPEIIAWFLDPRSIDNFLKP